MFRITRGKGFQLVFANGWTASVQFGPGNYCEHQMASDYQLPQRSEQWESGLAEIAAWDADGKWMDFGGDTVDGHISADKVSAFLVKVAAQDA